jgi:hypothetical protein
MQARKSPPFRLPGEHFIAAWLFFLFGVAGLIWVAPDLAQGMFLSTRVAGVTHLFTLGWITTTIMGALYQFLPVALLEPIRSQRVAHITFYLYVPGLAVFIIGLLLGHTALLLPGVALFGTGVLLFIGNMAATLRGAKRRDVTWWALTCATAFLFVTLILGGTLAGNQRYGYLASHRMTALGVHIHVALAGWVLMVMTGVAHRLFPMFLLSHDAGDGYAKASVALNAAGVVLLLALHHMSSPFVFMLPALFVAAGVFSFVLQAREFYSRRRRSTLDPGMRLAALALGVISVALVMVWPVILRQATANFIVAYILCVVLGISLFVAAHYYKIIPFLVWFHRYSSTAGREGGVRRVGDLFSASVAFTAAGFLVAGVILMTTAVTLGSPVVARVGAIVFGTGAVVQATQMIQLARSRPWQQA